MFEAIICLLERNKFEDTVKYNLLRSKQIGGYRKRESVKTLNPEIKNIEIEHAFPPFCATGPVRRTGITDSNT